jgi:uncharacterized protein with HEPN domain
MENQKDKSAYFKHILDAIYFTEKALVGIADYDQFKENEIVVSAVLYQLVVIGEAASKIDPNSSREIDNIDWQDIRGMRNRLVHAYFEINTEIVWDVVTKDLPDLKRAISNYLVDSNNSWAA